MSETHEEQVAFHEEPTDLNPTQQQQQQQVHPTPTPTPPPTHKHMHTDKEKGEECHDTATADGVPDPSSLPPAALPVLVHGLPATLPITQMTQPGADTDSDALTQPQPTPIDDDEEPDFSNSKLHKLVRQNTPRMDKKKGHGGSDGNLAIKFDLETDDGPQPAGACTPLRSSGSKSISQFSSSSAHSSSPHHVPPPAAALPSAPCIHRTTVGSDGIPRCLASSLQMTSMQRSVSEQTHVAPERRKEVRFSLDPMRDTDSNLSSAHSSTSEESTTSFDSTNSDDIRHRGIPEDKHWIYRLLDPTDLDITFQHCNDHPEIWTDSLLNDFITYVRPHDLTGLVLKGLRIPGSSLERNCTISFRNLSYTDDLGRPKLQGITGYIRPKMMLCCLGGPDAGITTFLDVVAGRQKGGSVSGELLCDGMPYTKSMSRAMGYVVKEDANLPTLTVRETLLFSAHLRQPTQRAAVIEMRVKLILKFMGMLHCADTIVGNATLRGISGGEKRRLSYACETVGGHACVLADLPTNGLDSASAYASLATIQKGCMAGRSVAASLVQPSPELFRLFSHVLVLSKGAQLYFGPSMQVELYFGHHGFKRPKGKELPDFLEELSTTPGKFYVGQPPSPVDYLQRSARDPEEQKRMVDIDSLQATAARLSQSDDYKWSFLTDEDERDWNCAKDDQVSKAVIEVSVKGNINLGSGRPSSANTSFRQAALASSSAYTSHAATSRSPLQMVSTIQPLSLDDLSSKKRGLKRSTKSQVLMLDQEFDVPFEVMDDLCAQEAELAAEARADPDGTNRDLAADESKRQYLLQRKWVWLVQCYRRSPIWDKIGQRMFADMLHSRGEPVPYTDEVDLTKDKRKVFKFHSSIWRQIYLTTLRQWLITIRNPAFTKGAVFRNLLIGLLIGSLFYMIGTEYKDARTRFGLFYFIMSFCSMAVVQMIPQLMEQRNVYYHQLASGYFNGLAYYLAFILTSIPFAILEIFFFLIIVYPMSGLRGGIGSQQFFYTWLILFILNMTTRAWVLFIASVSKNQTIAQSLCPVSLVLMQIFCGYMVPYASIPDGWVWAYYISPFTYTIKGLVINELYGLDFTCTGGEGALPPTNDPRLNLPPPTGFGGLRTCPLKDGHDVLALYDMDVTQSVQKWYMLLWLIMFFIGFNILSALALLFVDHSTGDTSENPNWSSDVRDHSSSVQSHPKRYAADPPPVPPEVEAVKVTLPKKLIAHQSSLTAPAAYISFNNLCYSVKVPAKKKGDPNTRLLLNKCFGFATPKNMVALMGASGAGKTTLLDVLAGKKTGGVVSGDILVNGKPRDISFSHIAGYVEQFDSHDPLQTIREAIEFSAELRLDSSFTREQRKERVDDVILALGLDHMQHHLIGSEETGGISPELRKKTTIAVELVMAPSLLFLDEPTTGLDSAGALAVMHAVSRLAQTMSVICTIHQPSREVVSLFNSILLLKKGGEVAYFGPISGDAANNVRGVVEYFEDPILFKDHIEATHPMPYLMGKNKADFALEQIRSMEVDLVDGVPRVDPAERFLATDEAREIKRQLDEGIVSADSNQFRTYTSAEATGMWTQYYHLVIRNSRSNFRNVPIWRTRFLVPIFISLMLGTLYFQLGFSQFAIQNRISLAYLQVIFLCFSAAAFLPQVFAFRPVFFREVKSHMYSAIPFWLARFTADLPYVIIEIMIYSIILYWIAGLTAVDTGARWGYYILALFGTRLAALGWTEGLGRLVPDIAAATGLLSILNTVMMLFTGFLIQKSSIPQGWLWMYYVSFFRYAVSFLCANELRDENFYCSASEVSYVPTSAAPGGSDYQCQGDSDPYCLPVCPYTTGGGAAMLEQFSIGYSSSHLDTNLGVIFVFAVGFQLINLFAIRFVNHVKR